ncbi:extradiol ring-cleavage dioxygenase [Rhizobiales bacterium L72]|uniref:Extradiol ring-cleavage dioxygenase n=2 Tax=Propylenella binzhouense TaxID=2555902 RepID=A0A964T6W2_9HYPH|nr:extradiol ring-cleavage dioxygenase [Propylenella binzhouense]
MAQIVLGVGASHSPLLNSPAEDYPKHAEIDASGRKLLDRNGRAVTYGELLERADPAIRDQIRHEVLEERTAACTANIERLDRDIRDAELDALIIIGDDQNEQYGDDNMPAILVYRGRTIVNNPLMMGEDAPEFWRHARSQYHVKGDSIEYPVAHELAAHLIDTLMDDAFDIAQATRLAKPHGEGHAFGYVHQRLMTEKVVPIVPVALNTYFPPNQPRPRRCYELGRAIAKAVQSFEGDARVGILGSGGLSHFAVDEELDRMVLDACRTKDGEALSTIDPARLNSGTSEVRNWITVAGACEHLDTAWQEYIPCYRSPAGTGCGMGFAVWR